MTLTPGTKLGPYEILAPIGAGGMGEVYRARDTRLDRTVAVKVLPRNLADNPELRQRFEREARAVSSLNHPHICVLHDIGRHEGIDFLVMEYLEGETLAARLAQGPLPLEQALQNAAQVADALSQAHRQGVYHRDLKPGNIMLTKTGAKLLDFGLAKLGPAGLGAEAGDPTLSRALTQKGTILGTLQYMSPEQLDGREVDGRSDIFSFGVVLYEMVTGRKAFEGKGHASLIAAIMESDPPSLSSVQALAPAALDRLVRRCLAKDPDDRWQNARDVLLELVEVREAPLPAVPARGAASARAWAPWVVAALAVALAVGMYFWPAPAPPVEAVRFQVALSEKTALFPQGAPVISPDARRLAAVISAGGATQLWLRELDLLTGRLLPGTESTTGSPFWSPDSRSIGFFADGKLKRIAVSGGPAQTLCDAPNGQGGSWNREGVIVFTPSIREPLYRVAAVGGPSAPVTALDAANEEVSHRWPYFLPDGRHYLFFCRSAQAEKSGIFVGSLDSKDRRRLVAGDTSVAFAPSGGGSKGHLLFRRDNALMAQPFDAARLSLGGDPYPVAEQVFFIPLNSRAAFSVSETGHLVFLSGEASAGQEELLWFDRSGKQIGSAGLGRGTYHAFRISPDQKRVAFARLDPQVRATDIWLLDLVRGVPSRFTFHPSTEILPVWFPDGGRLVFSSLRTGSPSLYQKVASGDGEEQELLKSGLRGSPWDISPDGRFLLFSAVYERGAVRDLLVLPLQGETKPLRVVQSGFHKDLAQFSPDGRWIAYTSMESGSFQVFVQRSNAGGDQQVAGGKWQVSTAGGSQPRWRRDGKELFYLASDRKLMAVPVKTGESFEAGLPKSLFQTRISVATLYYGYDVTADGQRFLVNNLAEEAQVQSITVVLNWTAGLRR
jgi:Tol biopolymer transport system component